MNGPGTFSHTELLLPSPRHSMMEQFKLPASINYISLRETFISDAPFVKRTNASFWRKLLDSENFRAILSSNYHHIVGCIAESGMFDLESLYRFEGNQAVKLMSQSYAEMYFNFSIKERDMLFPKLPEVCLYMLINCLQSTHPKHGRVFGTIRFREIVLDYFSEMFTGIRLSNSHINREWIFQTATDLPILTYVAPEVQSKIKKHNPSVGMEKSTYKMANSPLVKRYIGVTEKSTLSYAINFSMTHVPERPLTTLPEAIGFHSKKPRVKLSYHEAVVRNLKETRKRREGFMSQFEDGNKSLRSDIRKMKETWDGTLKWIARSEKEARSDMMAKAVATGMLHAVTPAAVGAAMGGGGGVGATTSVTNTGRPHK